MMLVFALLLAPIVPYDKPEAVYRDCLSENARYLSVNPDEADEILANVADLACKKEHDAFLEFNAALSRKYVATLTDDEIGEMNQQKRNELVAWAEGIIFETRRSRATK